MKNFVEELRWRGMIQDIMPETEEHLMEGLRSAYIGFDPTADSLHIGHFGWDNDTKTTSRTADISRMPLWEVLRG